MTSVANVACRTSFFYLSPAGSGRDDNSDRRPARYGVTVSAAARRLEKPTSCLAPRCRTSQNLWPRPRRIVALVGSGEHTDNLERESVANTQFEGTEHKRGSPGSRNAGQTRGCARARDADECRWDDAETLASPWERTGSMQCARCGSPSPFFLVGIPWTWRDPSMDQETNHVRDEKSDKHRDRMS